jgi:hypothetical protein
MNWRWGSIIGTPSAGEKLNESLNVTRTDRNGSITLGPRASNSDGASEAAVKSREDTMGTETVPL